jgi:predicted nuclease with TOPRIM domain
MKFFKTATLLILVFSLCALTGCGVPKNKYEALLNEKMALEEKLNMVTKSRDALRAEYENLLKDKMDLSAKLETATNEKSALKDEYGKLLDEKVSLKAVYDKVAAGQDAKAAPNKPSKK